MGSLLVWLVVKSNNPIAISFHSNEGKMGAGAMLLDNFGRTPFQSTENTLFDIKRALQKGCFP